MIEGVLPKLVEKTQAKGWKTLIKMSETRLPDMDKHLWTYKDDSFLPHGRDDEPLSDRQPIILTSSASASGAAACVILLDQTELEMSAEAERCIILIEGQKSDSVSFERARWKQLQEAGADLSYWQQGERGDWQKRA